MAAILIKRMDGACVRVGVGPSTAVCMYVAQAHVCACVSAHVRASACMHARMSAHAHARVRVRVQT